MFSKCAHAMYEAYMLDVDLEWKFRFLVLAVKELQNMSQRCIGFFEYLQRPRE